MENESEKQIKPSKSKPWTVSVADDIVAPRIFLALHVYIPLSCDVTSWIIRLARDFLIRLPARWLPLFFSHITSGAGFPVAMHWNEAVLVSFTTLETGEDTMTGAEIDFPASPLGPGGPWSPFGPWGPGSPWMPFSPLSPRCPCDPFGPCLPGDPVCPGLPRLPLILSSNAWGR